LSVKIYTGFQFDTDDIREIFKHIRDFREELKPFIYEKTTQYFSAECTTLLDRISINPLLQTQTVLMTVYHQFKQELDEVKQNKQRNPYVDFDFHIVIIPTKDKILGMFFTEQQDFAKLWMNKSFVSDYSYWNNADQPEDMDDIEWARRKSDWMKEAFSDSDIPSEVGFTMQCASIIPVIPKINHIISGMPSWERRTQQVAEDALFREKFGKDDIDSSNVVMIYQEFKKWIFSEEGKQKMEEVREDLEKFLIKVPTEEHLTTNFNDKSVNGE